MNRRQLLLRGALLVALAPVVRAAGIGVSEPRMHRVPAALRKALRIAGLTTHTDFLVLRDQARDAGLAPLAMHDTDAGGTRRRATLIAWVLAPRAVA